MNIDRKLATVRIVENLIPIEGADLIELAQVDGWQVVVKKGEFTVGDSAVYFEIDSWIPHTLAPFLTRPGHEPKVYNNVPGQRLKTMKMKGVLSQGLLLPPMSVKGLFKFAVEEDLTETLGIQKWERPIPAQLAGTVKGNFPSFLIRTDEERIQNCYRRMVGRGPFEVTEKLDGSSMTVYSRYYHGEWTSGVCSRNLDLKQDENNAFWSVAIRDNIIEKMRDSAEWSIALQGELVGPGVQGNPYKLDRLEFYVFNMFNIDSQQYINPSARRYWIEKMGLNHVPVILYRAYDQLPPINELLEYANGSSILNNKTSREGLVFKNNEDDSFKVISNKWLLKEKE